MKKLLLFDIDGTLINSGEAGSAALDRVFHERFGIEKAFSRIECAGKTDLLIIKEGLSLHGLVAQDGLLASIVADYLKHLEVTIRNKKKHVLAGVVEFLEALRARGFSTLGLLTGNLEQGARIKLEPFGLNRYFPFGAFGSDHEDRNLLLPLAVRRFTKMTGVQVRYEDCLVVGDTPRDVTCSKPYGAVTVAVASGPYAYEALLKTGADFVLKDLAEGLAGIDRLVA